MVRRRHAPSLTRWYGKEVAEACTRGRAARENTVKSSAAGTASRSDLRERRRVGASSGAAASLEATRKQAVVPGGRAGGLRALGEGFCLTGSGDPG